MQHVPGHTGKLGMVEDKDGSLMGSLATLHDMKPLIFSSVVIQKSPVSSASGTFGEEYSGWNLETQGSEHNCAASISGTLAVLHARPCAPAPAATTGTVHGAVHVVLGLPPAAAPAVSANATVVSKGKLVCEKIADVVSVVRKVAVDDRPSDWR